MFGATSSFQTALQKTTAYPFLWLADLILPFDECQIAAIDKPGPRIALKTNVIAISIPQRPYNYPLHTFCHTIGFANYAHPITNLKRLSKLHRSLLAIRKIGYRILAKTAPPDATRCPGFGDFADHKARLASRAHQRRSQG